jgi:succinyldiaminopimelate transaminase
MQRRLGVSVDESAVLPLIGSKEFVAWLPTLLGLNGQSIVVTPELAYPTYDIGARVVGAEVVTTDSTLLLGPRRPQLLWLNSPSNPSGRMLPAKHLKKVVDWAREKDCLVVSDECYIELGWDEDPVSVLHPDVCGGTHQGLLAVHSLSKRSNLAGYRAAFVSGDATAIKLLTRARKHLGMLVPSPVQAAMVAALDDDGHVEIQRERYRRRRTLLRDALISSGFRIEHSQAGLYLWATRDEDSWASVEWFAERGILVAPGSFYGVTGRRHIRVAITASDPAVEQAAQRLTSG